MKRQFISLMIILPLLSLFSSLEVYAQSGPGDLPGTKPTPKPPTVRGSRPASHTPVIPALALGEARKGRLDPSDKSADGTIFEEMILKDAKSEDLLTFHIESDNPSLGLQILDKNNAEVAVAKDPSGDFKINTPAGGLPADGDYRIRVTCAASAGKNAVPFTIKVNRLLTTDAYAKRLYKIDNDPTAPFEKTVAELEELVKLAPDNRYLSLTLGRLIDIHLKRLDVVKAEAVMDRIFKIDGVLSFPISFDNKWRPMAKLRSGDFGFEDTRSGWLRIKAGQLTISYEKEPDARKKPLASLTGQQIRELSKNLVAVHTLVTITAENTRKPYVFGSETRNQAEADLVINLIRKHVMGKATVEDRR